LNPKFRVTLLNREERTKEPGTLSAVKRLFWYADGPRIQRGNGAGCYGKFSGKGSISLKENMLMFSRPRCMPSWTMHFTFVWILDQNS